MKKRIIAIAIAFSMLMSACSSAEAPQDDTVAEQAAESSEEKPNENADDISKNSVADNTQEIKYYTISLQIPANWKYVEQEDDSIMIYRSADSFFLCSLDAYNIANDVDESTTEEDIYPHCMDLLKKFGADESFSYENTHFLNCPGVRFSGSISEDDGTESVISGIVFVADVNIYIFYYMTDTNDDHTEEIKVADQILNSITISPDVNTGVYGGSLPSKDENVNATAADQSETKAEDKKAPIIQTAKSSKDMKLGDIGKKGDIFAGLSYVKKMSYVPTALYDFDEIGDGNEVILAFFDFYNASESKSTVHPEDITCYADGTQVLDAKENYLSVYCDGIRQMSSVDMDGNTQMISVHDFIVPSGWSELKFFYESECVWTVSADDASTEAFEFESMYPVEISREPTEEETVIYNGDYEIVFKGASDYTDDNAALGQVPYVIFKFTINNTSSAPLDYSLAGYEMRGYQDNYSLGESSFTLDKQIDGYSNIYSIDKIEAGMSANVYIAFDAFVEDGDLYMIYDDGYIQNNERGSVFVDR